jgi:hypothetical protein
LARLPHRAFRGSAFASAAALKTDARAVNCSILNSLDIVLQLSPRHGCCAPLLSLARTHAASGLHTFTIPPAYRFTA